MRYQIHNKGKVVKFSTKPSQVVAAYEDDDGRCCIDVYPEDDTSNSYLKIWFNSVSLHIIAYDSRQIYIIIDTGENVMNEIRETLTEAGIEVAGGDRD